MLTDQNSSAEVSSQVAVALPKSARFMDLTGARYGRLVVKSFSGRRNKHSWWNCECDCGTLVTVTANGMRTGDTTSCGCLRNEATGNRRRIHGETGSSMFNIWSGILKRCSNPNCKAYKNYGARGISVHSEFLTFVGFSSWVKTNLGDRPSLSHSLDRIDNEKDYAPGNLRWATPTEQALNTRFNRLVNVHGVPTPAKEAARAVGMNYGTLIARLGRGWSDEKALTASVAPRRKAPGGSV